MPIKQIYKLFLLHILFNIFQPVHVMTTPTSLTTHLNGAASELYSPNNPNNPALLREQLQLHLQTIGILVAEKTELQSKQALHQTMTINAYKIWRSGNFPE